MTDKLSNQLSPQIALCDGKARLTPLSNLIYITCFVLLLTSCAVQPFSEQADKQFTELVDVQATQTDLPARTDKIRYQSGKPVHFWLENKSNQTIWFANGSFDARGYQYDETAQRWQEVELGIIRGTQKQEIPPGRSDLKGIPIWAKITPGPLRLVLRGSTSAENPGVDGEIYTTYLDVVIAN